MSLFRQAGAIALPPARDGKPGELALNDGTLWRWYVADETLAYWKAVFNLNDALWIGAAIAGLVWLAGRKG